jgi:hypothetical protein
MFSQALFAKNYEVTSGNDSGNGYSLSIIKDKGKEIAKFCLIDPERGFNFFSIESDSAFFSKTEKDFFSFSLKKKLGQPVCVIMADFSTKVIVPKRDWSLGYFFNSLGILVFAPPYLKRAEILNPSQTSKRFFIETKIGEKKYYGLLVSDSLLEIKEAKELIRRVKGLRQFTGNPTPMLDFPIKLLSFDGKYTRTIYESHKRHKNYTCLFLTGKFKTAPE